ncbi:MAG: L-serine ammonia-lyase, iron-sulfur-dependent, subunit alpha [Treponemataceae bacterium]
MINSFAELKKLANEQKVKISNIAIKEQISESDITEEGVLAKMRVALDTMLDSIEQGTKADVKSESGLTGGNAYKMKKQIDAGKAISGAVISNAIRMSIAVAEMNAAMGRIVAAPTAGSCGILPGALGAMIQERGVSKEDATRALFTAGEVGLIIANNASISGAEGGCQAECGTASAMAAAVIVELSGGTVDMCIDAVAIALKCILGLVCDPVAGLVEVPCVKRNASGVTLAFTAAEMALAGINSMLPADEVVHAMKLVGDTMPATLRETAEGGLATCPTAKHLKKDILKKFTECRSCMGCKA